MQDAAFGTHAAEVHADSVRRETLDGRDHLVAPVVAVRSMVLKGELLPDEEIEASAPAWNGVVLPIGHPTDADGNFETANTPATHDGQVVGKFFGAESAEGGQALTGEIWVDVEKSKRLAADEADDRFVKPLAILASHAEGVDASQVMADLPPALDEAVHADDVLEVSTAYWYHRSEAMGTHDGQQYSATQHHIRPDHLALLPNSTGECSVADGCGAPRTHVHANVDETVDAGAGDDGQTDDTDGSVTADRTQLSLNNFNMSEKIDWLAEHSVFDREALEGFDEDHLEALRESIESAASHDDGCACNRCADGHEQTDQTNDGDADDDGFDPESPESNQLLEKLETLEERVAGFEESLTAQERERREDLVDTIVANSSRFERETLEAIEDTDVLEDLAAEVDTSSADFGGRIGAGGTPGGDDPDMSAYTDIVRDMNPDRFGAEGAD